MDIEQHTQSIKKIHRFSSTPKYQDDALETGILMEWSNIRRQ